jgi:hypothetical protein
MDRICFYGEEKKVGETGRRRVEESLCGGTGRGYDKRNGWWCKRDRVYDTINEKETRIVQDR